MFKKKHALIIFISIFSILTYGQIKEDYINQKSKGLIVGIGFINEQLPANCNYDVYQLIFNYSFPLLHKSIKRKFNLSLQIEPQINPILIKNRRMEVETGVNCGFTLNYQLSTNLILDLGLGSGLHYITIDTNKQSRGFLFADNFILGISKRINGDLNNWELILQVRFRHMSNLELKSPNKGIDNFIFYCGISKLF